jgi:putative ABC transport system permease protein
MSGTARRLRAGFIGATGTGAAASIGLAFLVFTCTFIAAFLPRASFTNRTAALQETFAASGQLGRMVTATESAADSGPLSGQAIADYWRPVAGTMRADGLTLATPSAGWAGLTTATFQTANGIAQVELAYRSTLAGNARLVAGSLPVTAVRRKSVWVIQVAFTSAVAARMHVRVGTTLRMVAGIDLTVTAIVRPADPAAAFWTYDPTLVTYSATGVTGAFIGAGEVTGVQRALQGIATTNGSLLSVASILSWNFPLRLGGITIGEAPELLSQVQAVERVTGSPSYASPLASELTAFLAADEGINTVVAFLFVSLTVLAMIVVLQGARLLAEHRDAEFAVMRARGASVLRLCWLALRGGAVVAVPAAAAAVGAAIAARPGPGTALEWKLAALIVAVAAAGMPVSTVLLQQSRRLRRPGRAPSKRALAARRWVTDIALIAIALGGLVELRQLGPPPAGGLNLFTSAAPAIAALPAAVIAMRLYPVLLRWLLRLTRRRRGVALFVGFARSEQAALSTALPVFALVLALAIVSFGATLHAAVQRGDVLASWQDIGADAVITGQNGSALPVGLRASVQAVSGVQRTATATLTTGQADGIPAVPMVILDPAQYGALVAGTPAPAFPAAALARPASGHMVPVLVSGPAQSLMSQPGPEISIGNKSLNVRIAGVISSIAVMPGGEFIVVPSWAVPAESPNAMAVVGSGLDGAALAAVVRHVPSPTPALQLRSPLVAARVRAPLPRSAYLTSLAGLAATICLSLLSLLLALVLGARSRTLTQARLATMGVSRRQARLLGLVESVPAIVVAAAGGTACVATLIPFIAPAISLSAFTSSNVSAPFRTDPLALAGSAAALILLAVATIFIQVAVASHRGVARQLRVGE